MGSAAIIFAAVALAIALASLAGGFFWGRSNVKAQVEEAVEKEHVALDAREFAMRTQLEDAVAEIAKLRPLAEELGRVQKRLEREQSKYQHMKADFDASYKANSAENASAEELSQPAGPAESPDEAIQKLLQSLEAFNAPDAEVSAAVAKSEPQPEPIKPVVPAVSKVQPVAQPAAMAPPAPVAAPIPVNPPQPVPAAPVPSPASVRPQAPPALPAEPRNPVQKIPSKPVPAAPSSLPAKPTPAEPVKSGHPVDEWQEFARQLAALTGKKQ